MDEPTIRAPQHDGTHPGSAPATRPRRSRTTHVLLAIGMTCVLTVVAAFGISYTTQAATRIDDFSAEDIPFQDQSLRTSPGVQDQPQDSTPNPSEDNRLPVGPEGGSTSEQG